MELAIVAVEAPRLVDQVPARDKAFSHYGRAALHSVSMATGRIANMLPTSPS